LPDIVILLDRYKEYITLQECAILEVPNISYVNTNFDPNVVNLLVPANNDSIISI
jgi:ribosomal protein S2